MSKYSRPRLPVRERAETGNRNSDSAVNSGQRFFHEDKMASQVSETSRFFALFSDSIGSFSRPQRQLGRESYQGNG